MQEWEERELEKREAREEGERVGRAEGEKIGRAEGIKALILDNLEDGRSETQIVSKLIKRFGLSREEAENCVRKVMSEEP